MRLFRLLAVVALAPTGARLYAASPIAAKDEIPTDAVRVELICVIDGDTVDVDFDRSRREDPDRIRMIGIDTPETTSSYGNHPECYGEEASKKTPLVRMTMAGGNFRLLACKLADGEDSAGRIDDGRASASVWKLLDGGKNLPAKLVDARPSQIEIGDAIGDRPGGDGHRVGLRPQAGDFELLTTAIDDEGRLIAVLDVIAEEFGVERRRTGEVAGDQFMPDRTSWRGILSGHNRSG